MNICKHYTWHQILYTPENIRWLYEMLIYTRRLIDHVHFPFSEHFESFKRISYALRTTENKLYNRCSMDIQRPNPKYIDLPEYILKYCIQHNHYEFTREFVKKHPGIQHSEVFHHNAHPKLITLLCESSHLGINLLFLNIFTMDNLFLLKYIIREGFDPESIDWEGSTMFSKSMHILRYMHRHGYDMHRIDEKIFRYSVKGIPYHNMSFSKQRFRFIMRRFRPNVRARNSEALLYACAYGCFYMVRRLIAAGCSPRCNNDLPLYWASVKGHYRIVKYLVGLGADVRSVDYRAYRYMIDLERYDGSASGERVCNPKIVQYFDSLGFNAQTVPPENPDIYEYPLIRPFSAVYK